MIYIISVPNAATITDLVSTHTSITVTWSSPPTDYINEYTIAYIGMNVDTEPRSVTVSAPATTFTIDNLQSGETYVIAVTAVSGTERKVSRSMKRTTSKSASI